MINLILLLQSFPVSMQVNHKAVNHPFIEQQVFIQVRSITMNHYTYSSNWKIVNSWSHMNEIYLSKPLYVRSDNHFYVCWMQTIVVQAWGYVAEIAHGYMLWRYKKKVTDLQLQSMILPVTKKIIKKDLNLGPAPKHVVARKKKTT